MLLPSIILKRHRDKGRGLFATEFIAQGTVVWLPCKKCTYHMPDQLSSLSSSDLETLEELGYRTYDQGILLPCSNACYMNHSCNANVLDYGLDFGLAVKDIKPNDEICCDYHAWDTEEFEMDCRCGTHDCKLIINPQNCDDAIKSTWQRLIKLALGKMKMIKQPLHKQLLESSVVYAKQLCGVFNYLSEDMISVKQSK